MSRVRGELCFLSLPQANLRVRCDLTGKLQLSQNYLGWEAWRFTPTRHRWMYPNLSPWAHTGLFLSSTNEGIVGTTDRRGESEKWRVEKGPPTRALSFVRRKMVGFCAKQTAANQATLPQVHRHYVQWQSLQR